MSRQLKQLCFSLFMKNVTWKARSQKLLWSKASPQLSAQLHSEPVCSVTSPQVGVPADWPLSLPSDSHSWLQAVVSCSCAPFASIMSATIPHHNTLIIQTEQYATEMEIRKAGEKRTSQSVKFKEAVWEHCAACLIPSVKGTTWQKIWFTQFLPYPIPNVVDWSKHVFLQTSDSSQTCSRWHLVKLFRIIIIIITVITIIIIIIALLIIICTISYSRAAMLNIKNKHLKHTS